MRKTLKHLVLACMLLATCSCMFFDDQSTPHGYVKHCVRLLDKNALYADGPEWQSKKAEILAAAKAIEDMDEAHRLVGEAAGVAGGKHSRLAAPVKDTASYPETVPDVKMLEGDIAYVLLPAHSGVKVSDSLYLHTILDFLLQHTDVAGVVLDLRDNSGGNMYPMIAAVSPILPNGVILRFQGRKRTVPVSLEFVLQTQGLPVTEKFPAETPIAILTDDWTGSSGEATLLCFRGLPNVRSFGIPTAGYASANRVFPLSDGYTLVITTSCDMARTGEVFCDDPIAPDVQTENALEAALEWLREAK